MQVTSEERNTSAYQPPLAPTPDGEGVSLLDVLAPVLEGWRTLTVVLTIAGILTVAMLIFQRPKYEASVRLAAVGPQQNAALGGLASLAGLAAAEGGLNGSPALIQEFLVSNRVLRSVGSQIIPAPGGGRTRVVDLISEKDSGEVDAWKIERAMFEAVRTSISSKTGLINLAVRSRDSALARMVATSIVDNTRNAYVSTVRAQAAGLKRAQIARVDSAGRQLRQAEEDLLAFRRSNRVVVEYSALSLQQGRLEDAVSVARQVHTQAIMDREAAVAKELAETPAMIVADPLPPVIPPLPRRRAMKLAAILIVVGVFTAIWLIVRDGLKSIAPSRRAKIERVRRAAANIPVLGRLWKAA